MPSVKLSWPRRRRLSLLAALTVAVLALGGSFATSAPSEEDITAGGVSPSPTSWFPTEKVNRGLTPEEARLQGQLRRAAAGRDGDISPQHVVDCVSNAYISQPAALRVNIRGVNYCNGTGVIAGIRICKQVYGSDWTTVSGSCKPSSGFTYGAGNYVSDDDNQTCSRNLSYRTVAKGSAIHSEGVFEQPGATVSGDDTCN